MIWLTLRQHRSELLIAGVVVGTCVVALAISGLLIAHDYSVLSLQCFGRLATAQCDSSSFYNKWQAVSQFPVVMNIFPVLAAMFFAAPLVAGEIEAGTLHLVWSQSITRTRWIASKTALIIGGGILVGGSLSLAVSWWRQPFDELAGTRMATLSFDQEGIVTVTIFFFALSLGLAASAVLRRTLPAIAIVVLVFSIVRVGVAVLAPHLMPSVTWLPTEGSIPPAGLVVAQWPVNIVCPPGSSVGQVCQVDAVSVVTDAYFWRLQMLEGAIYAFLGLLFVWVTMYWVRRRID